MIEKGEKKKLDISRLMQHGFFSGLSGEPVFSEIYSGFTHLQ